MRKLKNPDASTKQASGQRMGIVIHRQFKKVRCVNGTKKVDVCRYSLLPDQIEKVQRLLEVAT